MRTTVLSVILLLVVASLSEAQMPKNSIDDYLKCVKGCQGLDNSGDVSTCIEGCRVVIRCPTLSGRVLTAAPNLTSLIDVKSARDGKIPIHKDKQLEYFALYGKGAMLLGYQVKNRQAMEFPLPLLEYKMKDKKMYFIFDSNGKLFQVKEPSTKFSKVIGKMTA
jgi:Holliday junction resolvase